MWNSPIVPGSSLVVRVSQVGIKWTLNEFWIWIFKDDSIICRIQSKSWDMCNWPASTENIQNYLNYWICRESESNLQTQKFRGSTVQCRKDRFLTTLPHSSWWKGNLFGYPEAMNTRESSKSCRSIPRSVILWDWVLNSYLF